MKINDFKMYWGEKTTILNQSQIYFALSNLSVIQQFNIFKMHVQNQFVIQYFLISIFYLLNHFVHIA